MEKDQEMVRKGKERKLGEETVEGNGKIGWKDGGDVGVLSAFAKATAGLYLCINFCR